MSDERLDRLIDEVARQMTESHPSSDFRARVMANLDRRPGRVWRPIWIVAPLGTLAVAVLVVLVARPFSTSAPHRVQRATVDAPKREERVGGQGHDRGSAASAPRPGGQAVKTEAASARQAKPDTTYERSQRETRGAAAGRRQAPSSGAAEVAALAPPPLVVPPLGVEAIGLDALPTGSIAVPQLDAIAPIEIAPLPVDDGRPSGTNEGRIDDSRLPTLDYRLEKELPC
jgi:hypothetical protein